MPLTLRPHEKFSCSDGMKTNMIVAWEPWLRVGAFLAVFVAMALWETARPRRQQQLGRSSRWPSNLGIVVLNSLIVRLFMPTSAVGLAFVCEGRGWGLFNSAGSPGALSALLGFVALDLAIYGQHVLFHYVPFLWRLHRMHHADQEFDVTTGIRFHPIEILLSMGIKFAVIAVLGVPATAVFIFELILSATSMFNHGNVALSPKWDSALRWFVVTPDMHRVHHSIDARETNSNFGFNFPWWDRVFGTYIDQPSAGHETMPIGICHFRRADEQRLDKMLMQPFRDDK